MDRTARFPERLAVPARGFDGNFRRVARLAVLSREETDLVSFGRVRRVDWIWHSAYFSAA